jgi:hypothetical protein
MPDHAFNVTAVFRPCDSTEQARHFDGLEERITRCGPAGSEARVDRRTGVLLVTFTWVGDPAVVIARLGEELAGDWTLDGDASYPTPSALGAPAIAAWTAGVALALALVLAGCVLVGWVPYDFDVRPLGYLLGVLFLTGPASLGVYLLLRRRMAASPP